MNTRGEKSGEVGESLRKAGKVGTRRVLACEAGDSIKPGASAPGTQAERFKAREAGDRSQAVARFAGFVLIGSDLGFRLMPLSLPTF